MSGRTRGLLALLAVSGAALAGGGSGSQAAWLGREVAVAGSPFCVRHGCGAVMVRRNDERSMGWQDGEQHSYPLRDGRVLVLDLRPAGTPPGQGHWISNARLELPGQATLTDNDFRLAANFYSSLTGRRFSVQGVAACRRAADRFPDPEGAYILLSRWRTPAGLPYRARCGLGQLAFWVGYRQQ